MIFIHTSCVLFIHLIICIDLLRTIAIVLSILWEKKKVLYRLKVCLFVGFFFFQVVHVYVSQDTGRFLVVGGPLLFVKNAQKIW